MGLEHVPSAIYTTKHGSKRDFPFIGQVSGHPIIRYVGTEIEFFDFTKMPTGAEVDKFKSIVTQYGGGIELDMPWNAEIVCAPARGQKFVDQVTDICEVLKSMGAVISDTYSGLHLHVDVREMKPNQLGRVMTMYSRFEPLIIQSQPYNRFKTKWCKPIGPSLAEGWDKIKRGDITGPQSLFKAKANQMVPGGANARYKAVNFAAFYKHGTIEIRMHEGTIDPKEIVGWAIFWVHFIQESSQIPLRKAKEFDDSLESLKQLVGPAHKYLTARIGQYKDQWTPTKVAGLLPSKAMKACCATPSICQHDEPGANHCQSCGAYS